MAAASVGARARRTEEEEVEEAEEEDQQNFRLRLAAAVRMAQWGYAIFWAPSAETRGFLAWTDGCYNGDIKTRKVTARSAEVSSAGEASLRTEQLRELYESLAASEGASGGNGTRRPQPSAAALSPEDLTDGEWYYLLCMSFTFPPNHGMPGRVFATSEPIWICNAPLADHCTFERALLTKNAGIQTVICAPFKNGVLELGTTELVSEDPAFVAQVMANLSEPPPPPTMTVQPTRCSLSPERTGSTCTTMCTVRKAKSIGHCHGSRTDLESLGSSGFDEMTGNDFDTDMYAFLNSPDNCIAQDSTPEPVFAMPDTDTSIHYGGIIKTILEKLHRPMSPVATAVLNGSHSSSFSRWKQCQSTPVVIASSPQWRLRRVLSCYEWMNTVDRTEREEASVQAARTLVGNATANHVMSERRRREKMNEKFLALRSLVPNVSKVDKASILGDTIEYIKELKQRIAKLELGHEVSDSGCCSEPQAAASNNHSHPDMPAKHRTVVPPCKRKAGEMDGGDEHRQPESPGSASSTRVDVTVAENEAYMKLRCRMREGLILEVIEGLGRVGLDPVAVQSAMEDDEMMMMVIRIRAKVMNRRAMATPRMIKQILLNVAYEL